MTYQELCDCDPKYVQMILDYLPERELEWTADLWMAEIRRLAQNAIPRFERTNAVLTEHIVVVGEFMIEDSRTQVEGFYGLLWAESLAA